MPEYYEIIKNPMDLTTIKKLVNNKEIITLSDLFKYINIIWYNCMEYNSEGSDIYEAAETLAEYTKEIMKV